MMATENPLFVDELPVQSSIGWREFPAMFDEG